MPNSYLWAGDIRDAKHHTPLVPAEAGTQTWNIHMLGPGSPLSRDERWDGFAINLAERNQIVWRDEEAAIELAKRNHRVNSQLHRSDTPPPAIALSTD